MKTTFGLTLLAALSLAIPTQAQDAARARPVADAELNIHPEELAPDSTIEVVFPAPMIAKEKIGSKEASSPLIAEPALAGEFQWVSTRSGHFLLTQAPKFGTEYVFSLRAGLRDLAGVELAPGELGTAASASFKVSDQAPRWFYDEMARRVPKLLFEFNDAVNASEAARQVFFASEKPELRVAAKVRLATGADFSRYNELDPTWAEEIAGVKPVLAPEAARLSALVIEPAEPLPVADDWALHLPATLTNASGHDELGEAYVVNLGDIQPFRVTNVEGHTPFDRAYYAELDFNKGLVSAREAEWTAEELSALAAKLAEAVQITPEVADLKAEVFDSTLRLSGGFALGTLYRVTVTPGIVSEDGLPLDAAMEHEIQFVPNPPQVAAPAFVRAQLAGGAAQHEIVAANVSSVRVRAKRLNGAELLQTLARYRGYESFYHRDRKDEERKTYQPEPLEGYPGTVVFDRSYQINKPLDHSEKIKLNWREMLGDAAAAPLFLECEGRAMEGLGARAVVTQTLVQFTDIGLMQKSNGKETLIFATSLKSGEPLAGARLTLVDEEMRLVGHADTDASGLAVIPGNKPTYVLAEKAGDCAVLRCDDSHIGHLIPYEIFTAWEDVWQPKRQTFVFSDRPLYRPGDTMHLKAISRVRRGDDLTLPAGEIAATITVRDPRYRVVMTQNITFQANGSWAGDIKLPTGPMGAYNLKISFAKNGEDDDAQSTGGHLYFRIEDYKPNTFEVALHKTDAEILPDRLRLPLSARYFMGKALSRAKAEWTAFSIREFSPPAPWENYHFGDAPSWAGYGRDRDSDGGHDEGDSSGEDNEWWVNGTVYLDEEGHAMLEMPAPPADRAALPQQVRVSAEITDINQQTISASAVVEVPGADFILGLKGPDFFGTAGKETGIELVAVDSQGRPVAGGIQAEVLIERQEYHTLKIATAGGGTTTKDQVILREELKQTFALKAATAGGAPGTTVRFTPKRGGAYFVTASTKDAQGRKVLSRLPLYVIGGGEFPWAMEDGARINLQPEKKTLQPGEEAVIVVKSPIAGTALVTVERNRVHRHFVTRISPDQPVVRVPVQDEEAPNVFVSVVVIRGSDASPKQHKMPEYKLGYCELTVDSKAKELAVEILTAKPEVLPGEELPISLTVRDFKGAPVAGAEVALYASDEGVLSLVSHETPNPTAYFHAPLPLAIDNHSSFDDLLDEDTSTLRRGNKGFLVGGGGEEGMEAVLVRKNFVATPLWIATTLTDAQGRVSTTVKAPDNLTRYRLMAVATRDADRFGHGESAFQVNKPLMIEPVVPRFARLEDEVLLKAVLHNTTPHEGEVEVRLELDETADFIREERLFITTSLKDTPAEGVKSWTQNVTLKAHETAAVAFPTRFVKLGSADWKWTARTVKWTPGAPPLSDGSVSTLEVRHPVPELREVRYARVTAGQEPASLAAKINPALLEGEGSVQVALSTSRLFEARDALDYVLRYPYGCAEQTTSAAMPWLALGGYQTLFPEHLAADKRKTAIQAGVDRLLQMVTDGGGLAYWAGGNEPSLWASAYGGLFLLRARDAGVLVPDEVIQGLTTFLSKNLRGMEEEADLYKISDAALALYTLAKAGQPEVAYQTMLHGKRDQIPETARLFTALAMCLCDSPASQIKDMLAKPAARKAAPLNGWSYWSGNGVNPALRLIVCTHLGLKKDAEELALGLLNSRNGRGEWGNTFTNAWTLTSLAAYERSLKGVSEPLLAKVLYGAQEAVLDIRESPGSAQASFSLDGTQSVTPMRLSLPAQRDAFTRVEARAFPPVRDFQGENKGYGITRSYAKLLDHGALGDTQDLRVGDMVVVTLQIEVGQGTHRYLAIDDALPGVLEAINPAFDTQNQRQGAQLPPGIQAWHCDHRELRADRALFFTNYAPRGGKFQLRYLARVIAEGDTIAPPARIEAMYEPDRYGLSPAQRLKTLPSGSGQVAGR